MRIIIIISLIILMALPVTASTWQRNDRVGSSGMVFLKMGCDTRAASMGYAVTADAKGGSGFFLNPAFLPLQGTHIFTLEGLLLPVDIKMSLMGYARKFGSLGTFGISAIWLDAGAMAYESVFPPQNVGGEFTANDLVLSFNYGLLMTDKFSMGTNLKYVREQLEDETVSGWAADIGSRFYTGYKSLQFGMVVRNFGPDLGFFDGKEIDSLATQMFPLPIEFRLGLSFELFEMIDKPQESSTLGINMDFSHPSDDAESIDIGLEYGWRENYFLRAGYRYSFSQSDDAIRPLSFGAGMSISYKMMVMKIDLAYVDWGALGSQQRVGIGFEY
jgi:hypothetical protein